MKISKKLILVAALLPLAAYGVTLDLATSGDNNAQRRTKHNANFTALNDGKVEWRGSVTTAARDALDPAPSVGDFVYNTTTTQFEAYNGSSWVNISGAGTGTVDTSGTPVANDFARFVDGDTVEGRSVAEALADLGLENVDNTSDAAKPVSTAQQTALDLKANLASPALTGDPTAPTPSTSDNDTSLATTASVHAVSQAKVDAIDSADFEFSAATSTGEPLEADHSVSAIPYTGSNAGESVAVGDVVYLDATENEYMLADIDDGTNYGRVSIGIVTADATNGNAVSVAKDGYMRDDSWAWTPELPVYLSATGTTGNTLTQTAPDAARLVVGYAVTADIILIDIADRPVYPRKIVVSFDPSAICDGDVDRIFLETVAAPDGFYITSWTISFEADPTTEIDFDLRYADAYIGVANTAVIDVLDTTAGVASETTPGNINSGAAVANGKVLYGEFGTAYTEEGHNVILEVTGYDEGY